MSFLDKNVSLFRTMKSTDPYGRLPLRDYFDRVESGFWRGTVNAYREHSYDKKELACITPSGIFTKRVDSDLVGDHTGIIVLDLDGKDNPDLDIKASMEVFMEEPSVVCVHRSVSGKGLAIYVAIADNITYKDYNHIRKTFEMWYDVKFDKSTSNVSRLRIVSYDPGLILNEEPLPFDVEPPKEVKKDSYVRKQPTNNYNEDSEYDKAYKAIARCIGSGGDPTSTYFDWVKIGFALAGEFGEDGRGLFQHISSNHPDYSAGKVDAKYNNLIRYSNGSSSIGTLYYLIGQC